MSVLGGVRSLRRAAVTLGLAAAVVAALPSWSPADTAGFTNGTATASAQAFKVNPVMAYRIYPDGKKELVRGIDISGTPLVALQSIRAASREIETFNGVCGAESGWVPVSASAPSLLIERLEVEKGFTAPDRKPILLAPEITQGRPR